MCEALLGGDRQGSVAVVIGGEGVGGKIVGTVQLMDLSGRGAHTLVPHFIAHPAPLCGVQSGH